MGHARYTYICIYILHTVYPIICHEAKGKNKKAYLAASATPEVLDRPQAHAHVVRGRRARLTRAKYGRRTGQPSLSEGLGEVKAAWSGTRQTESSISCRVACVSCRCLSEQDARDKKQRASQSLDETKSRQAEVAAGGKGGERGRSSNLCRSRNAMENGCWKSDRDPKLSKMHTGGLCRAPSSVEKMRVDGREGGGGGGGGDGGQGGRQARGLPASAGISKNGRFWSGRSADKVRSGERWASIRRWVCKETKEQRQQT